MWDLAWRFRVAPRGVRRSLAAAGAGPLFLFLEVEACFLCCFEENVRECVGRKLRCPHGHTAAWDRIGRGPGLIGSSSCVREEGNAEAVWDGCSTEVRVPVEAGQGWAPDEPSSRSVGLPTKSGRCVPHRMGRNFWL